MNSVLRSRRLLVVATTLIALVLGSPQTAYADDAFFGTRNCAADYNCYVQSKATGGVEHYRCTTAWANCVLKGNWSNGSNPVWRASWHGGGNQGVFIFTSGELVEQYATCWCTTQPGCIQP